MLSIDDSMSDIRVLIGFKSYFGRSSHVKLNSEHFFDSGFFTTINNSIDIPIVTILKTGKVSINHSNSLDKQYYIKTEPALPWTLVTLEHDLDDT